MMRTTLRIACSCAILATCAQNAINAQVPVTTTDTAKLPTLTATAKRVPPERGRDTALINRLVRLTLPITASVTAGRVDQTVNLIDPEDAVKYLPSVFLRKRNYGDNQATLESRVWGVSSSARSLVFADGVLLSALIANNNTIGAPRWGQISPEAIERIDMMYGPFSAAYAGNSMGAVMEITTHMPQKFEAAAKLTGANQSFSLYGTDSHFGTGLATLAIGDRFRRFSFRFNGNFEQSESQPLGYVTNASFPANTTGGYAETNKLGAAANVLGATGLLHTGMLTVNGKLAYDLSPGVELGYTVGFWQNRSRSFVDSYVSANGTQTFAGLAGFASGANHLLEQHSYHTLALRTHRNSDWDYEAVVTSYSFDTDQQRTPLTATSSGTGFGSSGRIAVLDGSGWATGDAKLAWHRGGDSARHTVTGGLHVDHYRLFNPTYNTTDWINGDQGTVATEGDGKTTTTAAWLQDAWRITPALRLTLGARGEHFRGYDGYNVNGSTTVHQPEVSDTRISPKGILAWTPNPLWTVKLSMGKAYRFATAAELYQLVSTGTTFTSPNPDLKPDDDFSTELRAERVVNYLGKAQLSLFQDDVHDAIISQFLPLVPGSSTLFSYLANVDHVRARGFELGMDGLTVSRFTLSASVTYVDAKILAISGAAAANAPPGAAVGKRLPNIPDWRWNLLATYHLGDYASLSWATRYSGDVYTTLDNADVHPNTYQGFSSWLVSDARFNWKLQGHWDTSIGVDNVFNRKYFFFHPFPQRTVVASLGYRI